MIDEGLRWSSPVESLKGVGPARNEALRAAGVESVLDLLLTLPVRYEDRRIRTEVDQVRSEGTYTVSGRLENVSTLRIRRRMTLVRATLVPTGGTGGSLAVSWFNRPYLAGTIRPDADYLLHGSVRSRGEGFELSNPSLEVASEAKLGQRVVPIYAALGTVGPSLVRTLVTNAILGGALGTVEETLPRFLLDRHLLPPLGDALTELHLPDEDCDVESLAARSTRAHQRLVYGELLRHQMRLAFARRHVRALRKNHAYGHLGEVKRRITTGLPFRLTGSQEQ